MKQARSLDVHQDHVHERVNENENASVHGNENENASERFHFAGKKPYFRAFLLRLHPLA